jgi:hypothetical protein
MPYVIEILFQYGETCRFKRRTVLVNFATQTMYQMIHATARSGSQSHAEIEFFNNESDGQVVPPGKTGLPHLY